MTKMKKARKDQSKKSHQILNEKGRSMHDILKLTYPKLDLRIIAHKNFYS